MHTNWNRWVKRMLIIPLLILFISLNITYVTKAETVNNDLNNIDISDVNDNVLTNYAEVNQERISNDKFNVEYQAHIAELGWQDWKSNGDIAGTTGKSLSLEALNLKINGLPEGIGIRYRAHVAELGWQDWKNNGETAGTTGKSLGMEAIEINLDGGPSYSIMYRVHIATLGWQEWKNNGEIAGTTGLSKPIEAIEIKIIENRNVSDLKYKTHISNEGWKNLSSNNVLSGSSYNNQLEAFVLNLTVGNESIIKYRSYIKNIGWQDWKRSGQVSGTEGRNLPVQKIEISLDKAPVGYSIEYRVRLKSGNWTEWKKDGETIDSNGDLITGIQLKVVDRYSIPSISYQTHIEEIGWQNYVSNGETSGTTGKVLQVEGIKIDYNIGGTQSNIQYRTHIQDIGWQGWVSNNNISGTTGMRKRVEAIQIKLGAPIKGYKLKYRAHIRDIGWQEWKSEGEVAGTIGKAKAIEAIEIKFVEDTIKTIVIDPGHNFGGDDGAYSKHNGITYIERDINMQIAMKLKSSLELKGYNIILTREPQDRETIDVRSSLDKRVNIANGSDAELFISVHQNSASASSARGVEVYYSTDKPNGGIANSNKNTKSKELAVNISRDLSNQIGTINRGAKDEEFYVVKNTFMPSILIECGFITNFEEARKVSDSNYQQIIANSIANQVANSF